MPEINKLPTFQQWVNLGNRLYVKDNLPVLMNKLYTAKFLYEKIDVLFSLLDYCHHLEKETVNQKSNFYLIKELNLENVVKNLLMQLLDVRDANELKILQHQKRYYQNQDPYYLPLLKPNIAIQHKLGITRKKHLKGMLLDGARVSKVLSKMGEQYAVKEDVKKMSDETFVNFVKDKINENFNMNKYQQMSSTERKSLRERASQGWDAEQGVQYLNDLERESYRVIINDGKLYSLDSKDFQLKPYNTPKSLEESIFVMNAKGDLFIHPSAKFGKIHHSTLLGGAPVLFAGQIQVSNGKISKLDNLSGHYKPNERNILLGINYLQSRNVLMFDVELKLALKENNNKPAIYDLKKLSTNKSYFKSRAIEPFFEIYTLMRDLGSTIKMINFNQSSILQTKEGEIKKIKLNTTINKLSDIHENISNYLFNLESGKEKNDPIQVFSKYKDFLQDCLKGLKLIKKEAAKEIGFIDKIINKFYGRKTICDAIDADIQKTEKLLNKVKTIPPQKPKF